MYRNIFIIIFFLSISTLSLGQKVFWAEKVVGFSSQLSEYEYSAAQVLGKPNAMPQGGDNPTAWLPSRPNRQEYIHVTFARPIHVEQIVLAESYNPSALFQIYLMDRQGTEHLVHTFEPKPIDVRGRILNIYIEKTPYRVHGLRLVLDGKAVPGYSGVDAIGISSSKEPVTVEIDFAENLQEFIVTEKLSDAVNSPYAETRPLIAPDGKTLYFSRAFHPQNIGGDNDPNDIWYSEYDEATGKWKLAVNAGPTLNNKGSNFISSITPDGLSMTVLLGNIYGKRDKMKPGVSIATKTADGWSEPMEISIINAYIEDYDGNYFLANDRRTIIMAVNRYDSYGGKDLYVSFLQEDGRWTEPLNLGNDLNTAHDEFSPFLAADNETLYFSSKGYSGFGGADIYISRRLDDTWRRWTEPENLGSDINSVGDDVFFSIPPSGTHAYFAKGASERDLDIHRIEMPIFFQPSPVVSVKGLVLDELDKSPLPAKISYKILPENKEVGFTFTDIVTGEYQILLPSGSAYIYEVDADGYELKEEKVDLMEATDYREIEADLLLTRSEKLEAEEITLTSEDEQKIRDFTGGKTAKLDLNNALMFDFASEDVLNKVKPYLDRIAAYLKENTMAKLLIEGHTDTIGSTAYNQGLSERRARSVKDYFVETHKIDKDRIEYKGYGATRPIDSNDTSAGRARNRRVEFSWK
ncbi:MAG: OmpA family protein [Cyclobacteriaceae bacterium]|nr:OmpA family protein [Cyclobacteriaceae bacterium]